MSLPDDIIERILQMRDIYIAIKYNPCYEFSTWDIIGIFNNLKDAQMNIINYVIKKDIDESLYNPKNRFYLNKYGFLEEKERWVDKWQNTIGVSDYRIEVWTPNLNKPSNTFHFNFDNYVKNHIIEQKLNTDQVKEQIDSWRKSPNYIEFIKLFSQEKSRIKCPHIERESWYAT